MILIIVLAFGPLGLTLAFNSDDSMSTGLLIRLGLLITFMIGWAIHRNTPKVNKSLTLDIK